MRVATLVFYGIATLCLGSIALAVGGPRMLAEVAGSEIDPSRWQSAWAVGTVGLSILFLLYAAFSVGRRERDD